MSHWTAAQQLLSGERLNHVAQPEARGLCAIPSSPLTFRHLQMCKHFSEPPPWLHREPQRVAPHLRGVLSMCHRYFALIYANCLPGHRLSGVRNHEKSLIVQSAGRFSLKFSPLSPALPFIAHTLRTRPGSTRAEGGGPLAEAPPLAWLSAIM